MGLEQLLQHAQSVNISINELLLAICCTKDKMTAGRAAVLIWNLWQKRNDHMSGTTTSYVQDKSV
jgi:hypothetical protein